MYSDKFKGQQILFSLFLVVILFFSCETIEEAEKPSFSENELKMLEAYHKDDTIYFDGPVGDVDTISITGIYTEIEKGSGGFISKEPSLRRKIVIKHLPVDNWKIVTYSGKEVMKEEQQILLSLTKSLLAEGGNYCVFSFKDFSVLVDSVPLLKKDTITLKGKSFSNYVILKRGGQKMIKDSSKTQAIYWSEREGLFAYENFKGDVWVKR